MNAVVLEHVLSGSGKEGLAHDQHQAVKTTTMTPEMLPPTINAANVIAAAAGLNQKPIGGGGVDFYEAVSFIRNLLPTLVLELECLHP